MSSVGMCWYLDSNDQKPETPKLSILKLYKHQTTKLLPPSPRSLKKRNLNAFSPKPLRYPAPKP